MREAYAKLYPAAVRTDGEVAVVGVEWWASAAQSSAPQQQARAETAAARPLSAGHEHEAHASLDARADAPAGRADGWANTSSLDDGLNEASDEKGRHAPACGRRSIGGGGFEVVSRSLGSAAPSQHLQLELTRQRLRPIDPEPVYRASVRPIPLEAPQSLTDAVLELEYNETRRFLSRQLSTDPRLKPADVVVSTDHMRSCAICANERGHRASLHALGAARRSVGEPKVGPKVHATPAPPRNIGERTQLFVDDWVVHSYQNVRRFVNPPSSREPILRPAAVASPPAARPSVERVPHSYGVSPAGTSSDGKGTPSDGKDTRFGCPCSVAPAPNGGVWLWHAATPHGSRLRLATHPSECRATDPRCFKPDEHAIVRRWSPDGHTNWSAPVAVSLAGKPKLRTFWVGASTTDTWPSASMVVASPGTSAVPQRQPLLAGYEGIWGVACLASSTDGGMTWRNLASPADRATHLAPGSEASIAVCADRAPSFLQRAADAYVTPVTDGRGTELVYYRKDFGTGKRRHEGLDQSLLLDPILERYSGS